MSDQEAVKKVASPLLDEIKSGGEISVPSNKAPKDTAKAQTLTKNAIENLGGPVYASMTDHKVADTSMDKAKIDVAIQRQGEISVPSEKTPADRAITEALTMKAIAGQPALKKTDSNIQEGLTKEQLEQLQKESKDEKDRKEAARTFGGGDAKEGMGNILEEIKGQGGIIAVPSDKAPKSDISLSHAMTLMEINSMKGEAIYASGTDGTAEDKSLNNAKLLVEIAKQGEISADSKKVADLENKAPSEAKTIMALSAGSGKSTLKHVGAPAEGLSKEQLAALQSAAAEEKK
jgi:hypothetical protein